MKQHWNRLKTGLKDLPLLGDFFEDRPRVAVIRFAGVIADSQVKRQAISFSRYAKILEKAFGRPALSAVAILINSPGGAAAQSALVGGYIRRLADEKNVPVYAFVEDVAASGGYWLACAADEIYAMDVSIVGSIGVISAGFGFEGLIEKHGVTRRVHASGADKSFLDPFLPERKEDIARLDVIQKDIHFAFKEWVRERRGDKLKGKDKDLFEGAFWTAPRALDLGLIDGIADMHGFMRDKYGDDVKLIDCAPERKMPFSVPFVGRLAQASLADDLLDSVENRALWSRFGL